MASKNQRVNMKRRLKTHLRGETNNHSPLTNPHAEWIPLPYGMEQSEPSVVGGLMRGLRNWCAGASGDAPAPEQDIGVHVEFDTDVVDALVYTVGRWMGLDTEQLRDSPGLRTLVSRNIQWFRTSPDWLKLTGLVLAKKLNHSLDCPRRSASDTQRVLLERLLQMNTTTENTEEGQTDTTSAEASDAIAIEPAPTNKKKTTQQKKKKSSKASSTTKDSASVPKTKTQHKPPKPTKKSPVSPKTKKRSINNPVAKKTKKDKPPATKKHSKRVKLHTLLTVPSPSEVSVDTDPMELETVPVSDPAVSCSSSQMLLVEETMHSVETPHTNPKDWE